MYQGRRRTRPTTVTRTYQIQPISTLELTDDDSDNESVIEIRPIKSYRHHQKRQVRFGMREPIITYSVTGKI